MIYYTCWLLVIGTIATFLGLDGVGAVAIELAAVLFIIEMIRDLALHLAPQWAAGQA